MRSVYGGSSDGVPWWRVALGYARVIARDTYARGVALAIAAWIAARWQVPGAVQWVDTAWALLSALLGAGLAVERVRSGAAAAALDESLTVTGATAAAFEESRRQANGDRDRLVREISRVREWASWGLAQRQGALLGGVVPDPELERRDLVTAAEGILSGRAVPRRE